MVVDKINIKEKYNRGLYEVKTQFFITSNEYWDGGIKESHSLEEKSKFYFLANEMSKFIKNLVHMLNEEIYVADFLCENNKMFENWSDIKKQKLFSIVANNFQKKKCYKLVLPEDSGLIDLIVESNFNYLTNISFYLSNSNIIIQPTCHTELIIYSFDDTLGNVLEELLNQSQEIFLKKVEFA